MKSRFDKEVDAIMEGWARAGMNALAGAGLAATGIMPLQTAVSSVQQAYNAGDTTTPTTTSKPASTPATTPAAGVPIKNIANFDTKLKNLIDTSNMLPADKVAIKSAIQGLRGSASRQLTSQDVATIIASLR
jgi:hypothetical protein